MITIGKRQIKIVDLESDPRFFHYPDNEDNEAYWLLPETVDKYLFNMIDDKRNIYNFKDLDVSSHHLKLFYTRPVPCICNSEAGLDMFRNLHIFEPNDVKFRLRLNLKIYTPEASTFPNCINLRIRNQLLFLFCIFLLD